MCALPSQRPPITAITYLGLGEIGYGSLPEQLLVGLCDR